MLFNSFKSPSVLINSQEPKRMRRENRSFYWSFLISKWLAHRSSRTSWRLRMNCRCACARACVVDTWQTCVVVDDGCLQTAVIFDCSTAAATVVIGYEACICVDIPDADWLPRARIKAKPCQHNYYSFINVRAVFADMIDYDRHYYHHHYHPHPVANRQIMY
jgi:hypothetical protein